MRDLILLLSRLPGQILRRLGLWRATLWHRATLAQVGAGNTNATINAVLSLLESTDDTVANATAVPSDRIIENGVLNAANTAFTVSVAPTKRYLFANVVPSAAFTSNVSVVGILGDPTETPT
jgi:hypothetical protein